MIAGRRPLPWVRVARVGSANGPKRRAVEEALASYCESVVVESVAVESGVSEQPVGFGEIARGARNRAHAAFVSGDCDLAFGIEDGLVVLDSEPDALNVGCTVVTDGARESLGWSSAFAYPPSCSEAALRDREPIGGVFDSLWSGREDAGGSAPSALSVGNVGKLTLGVLTRSEYGRHAVLCALVRFLHPDLYFGDGRTGPGMECGRGAE